MKELNFLSRLKKEGKLKLVEPSEEIKISYLEKAENSLKSAKVLLQSDLHENSVAMSYYVMYNSLTALLYKTGIKCENHTGSILLLKLLFDQENLSKGVLSAKEERIDKQYHVNSKDEFQLNKESTEEMMKSAEDFLVEIKLIIDRIGNAEIKDHRVRFLELTKNRQKKLKYEKEPKEIIKVLKKAYKERRKVKMQYYSLSSDESRWREVSVYQIGKDYIIAYCHLRDGERTFIINRIGAVAILDEKYSIPNNWTPKSIVNGNPL